MTDRLPASDPAVQAALGKKGRSKYGAKKTIVDGIQFDSIGEATRWQQLSLLQKAGHISNLAAHESFPLVISGQKIGKFTPDFTFVEDGQRIAEDWKSAPTKTTAYRLRVKLFKACYQNIEFRESEGA